MALALSACASKREILQGSTIEAQSGIIDSGAEITNKSAHLYCLDTAKELRGMSYRSQTAGWITAVGGAALSAAGLVMGPGRDESPWYERNQNTLAISAGAILIAVSQAFFARSDAASVAGANAYLALPIDPAKEGDELRAYRECVNAVGEWLRDRTKASSLGRDLNGTTREQETGERAPAPPPPPAADD